MANPNPDAHPRTHTRVGAEVLEPHLPSIYNERER